MSMHCSITSVGGSGVTFLDPVSAGRVFTFVAGESGWVTGVTLRNGMSPNGGCVLHVGANVVRTHFDLGGCWHTSQIPTLKAPCLLFLVRGSQTASLLAVLL